MPRKRIQGKRRIEAPVKPGKWQEVCFVGGCDRAHECVSECFHSKVSRKRDSEPDPREYLRDEMQKQERKEK